MRSEQSTARDLELLETAVALTSRRVNVPVAGVFQVMTGRAPHQGELLELRLAVLRLERDGLVRSDRDGYIEPTPDGQVAVELRRMRGRQTG